MTVFEKLLDLTVGNAVDLQAESIAENIRIGLIFINTVIYILGALIIVAAIVGTIGFISLVIAMRTPLRPYIVDALGFNTTRSYAKYKKIKRAKQLNRK